MYRIFAHAQQVAPQIRVIIVWLFNSHRIFLEEDTSQGLLIKLVFFAVIILRMLCSTFAMLFMAALLLSSSLYREIVWMNHISVPRIAGEFDECWNWPVSI